MKLSIITINYNNKPGLEKTVESVMAQTWRDFEWIIIDGGSTDGSKNIIDELVKNNKSNVSYWCSESDKGIYNAMNKGIAKANGKYVNFMNSGDCFHSPNTLDQVFNNFIEADIIYGDQYFIHKDYVDLYRYPIKLTFHYFLLHSIGHASTFIKSSLLKEEYYCEEYKIVSDWYWFFKKFIEGKTYNHIDIIVSDFDFSGVSNTNHEINAKERQDVLSNLFCNKYQRWVYESMEYQRLKDIIDQPNVNRAIRLSTLGGKRGRIVKYVLKMLNFLNR